MPELGKATYVIEIDTRKYDRGLDRAEKRTDKSVGHMNVLYDHLGNEIESVTEKTEDHGKVAQKNEKKVMGWSKAIVVANQSLSLLGKTMGLLKFAALGAAAGAAGGALTVLAGGAAQLVTVLGLAASSIVSVVGALGSLTGVAATAAAGLGTLVTTMITVKLGMFGVGDALKAATEAAAGGKEEMKAYQEELKKLSPAAQAFVKQLAALKPKLDAIRETAAEGMLPGMGRGVDQALENFDVFDTVVQATAGSIGFLAEEAGKLVGSGPFGTKFERIGRTNALLLRQMGGAGLDLFKSLVRILDVARPLTRWIGGLTRAWAGNVDEQTKASKKSGEMADFFDRTKRTLSVVGDVLGGVGKALINIGSAGRRSGMLIMRGWGDALDTFNEWAESTEGRDSIQTFFERAHKAARVTWRVLKPMAGALADIGGAARKSGMQMFRGWGRSLEDLQEWTSSKGGQEKMKQWFEDIRKPTRVWGEALKDVGKWLLDLADDPVILEMSKAIREDLLPPLLRLGEDFAKRLGPPLISILSSAVVLFEALGPAIEIVIWPLDQVLKGLAWMVENVPGFKEAATALATVGTALSGIGLAAAAWKLKTRISELLGFKAGLEVLKNRVPGVATALETLGGGLKKAGQTAKGWIGGFLGGLRSGAGRVKDVLGRMVSATATFASSAASAAASWLGSMGGALRKGAGKIKDVIMRMLKGAGIMGAVDGAGQALGGTLVGGLSDKVRSSKGRLSRLGARIGLFMGPALAAALLPFFADVFDQVFEWTDRVKEDENQMHPEDTPLIDLGGVPVIGGGLNDAQNAINEGFNDIMPGGQRGGLVTERGIVGIPGFQRGGGFRAVGPQAGPRDKIPALLAVGEMVLPKEVVDETKKNAKATSKGLNTELGKGHDDAKDKLTKFAKTNEKVFKGIHDKTTKQADKTGDGVSRRADQMGRSVTASYRNMARGATDGLMVIEDQTNKAMRALGVKPLNFGVSTTGGDSGGNGGPKRQRGGWGAKVPGSGSGDKVPVQAMTEPGEGLFVMNRNAMSVLEHMNGLFPRRAGGGMVDPRGPGTGVVNPAIAGTVGRWSQKYQAAINYGYDPGGGHVSPGHNVTGTATDTSPAGGWAGASLQLFEQGLRALVGKVPQILYGTAGIGTPYPNHGRGNHAHIEWGSAGGIGGLAMAQMVKNLAVSGSAPGRDIIAGALGKVRGAANSKIQKMMGRMGQHGAGGMMSGMEGSVVEIWAKVAKRLSTSRTATLASAMAGLAESGMRNLDYGDSTSKGPLQLLSSTAAGLGVSPNDVAAVFSLFFTRGFYGKGGANKLASQGLPAHLVAQGVQGSAFSDGSNYAAQKGAALALMKQHGFRRRGGPVVKDRSYVVGEHGPEVFRPRSSGHISNGKGGRRITRFKIENWREGIGMFEEMVDDAIEDEAAFAGRQGRMGK